MTIACLTAAIAAVSGCAREPLSTLPSDVDPKFGLEAFVEDGELVTLIVGTRVAKMKHDRGAMPVEIAVVNKGLPGLELTAESFVLIDEEGNRYAAAARKELSRIYGNTDVDRRLAVLPVSVRRTFASYTPFLGSMTSSFGRPIVRRVQLSRFSYLLDFIYFPTPETGIRGRKFELFMDAPQLQDPVFVRFAVDAGKR